MNPFDRAFRLALIACLSLGLFTCRSPYGGSQGQGTRSGDPLPSWNEGPAKARILAFVAAVTREGSPDFVPESERIAVFDNDGTLWPEQPIPNQLQYAIDYVQAKADLHPEWQGDPILRAVTEGDLQPMLDAGLQGLITLLDASHTEMPVEQYDRSVATWMDTAIYDRFNQPYDEVVYQPMLEVLDYFRANGFMTWIVSGGGADFMRTYVEEAYGIPPWQIVGSYGAFSYEVVEGRPTLIKRPEMVLIDDQAGKPVGIRTFIGKRPIVCFGNSDGDQAMMQYTSAGEGPSLCAIIRHTDAEREYAYALETLSGHLEKALVEAEAKDWLVIDMARDWGRVWPFEN